MPHTIEPALSGRAKCRGCARAIKKGALRLGERLPNPFADEGEITLWFHLDCGAFKRPEATLAALEACDDDVDRRPWLEAEAKHSLEHRRLPRIDGAERSSTGRASCRSCHEKIPKDSWRLRLVYFDEARFVPSGFIHAGCAGDYIGTADIMARIVHFDETLTPDDQASLASALGAAPAE